MEKENILIDKAELQQAITDGVKSIVKELKLDKVQSGTDFFDEQHNQSSEAGYALHSLLCAIKKGDKDKINAVYSKAASPMTEGTPADGGYLVPAITQNTILELIPTYGQARQFMSKIPMGKASTLNIPKEANLPVVNWVNENAAISDAKPTLGQITLTAKKAAGIVVLSNELLEDANVDLGNYILRKFAQKFGTAEDVQFFNGSGSPFRGVFSAANTFGNTVTLTGQTSSLRYADIVDCVYGIDASYLSNASWFMHRSLLAQVRKLADDQNNPIFVPGTGASPATLLGYPVQLIENAPTASADPESIVMILGNLENSYIGTKSELSVKILEEASVGGTSLAENDLSAIRVIERVGFDAGLTNAYSVIKLAAV